MKKQQELKNLFAENSGILSIKAIQESKLGYYHLNPLIEAGLVERIAPGMYHWTSIELDDLAVLALLVPHGTFCLYTSAAHFELTTFISTTIHVAIQRDLKIPRFEYPPVTPYYWNDQQLEMGRALVDVHLDIPIYMYDKEKTVCDFLKFRNKTGIDLAKEVLINYLKSPSRNLVKLFEYARSLQLESILTKYLEVLV